MKRNVTLLAALCIFAMSFAMAVAAQDAAKVAGNWDLTITTPRGARTNTLALTQDGGKIKGTLKNPRGEAPVDGTVDGNKITFNVTRQGPDGQPRTQAYTGTVDGDAMKGTVKFGENSIDWTAKRAAAAAAPQQ